MIRIMGSKWRWSGEVLTEPTVIYVEDHHYDEEARCFHLEKLMEHSAVDPQEHLIVFDHVLSEDVLAQKYRCAFFPVFQAAEVEQFSRQSIRPNWSSKPYTFNFMINKPRIHREFLLILIKHFGLTNYTHTLPWQEMSLSRANFRTITDNADYLQMIDRTVVDDIPFTDYKFGPERTLQKGILNGSFPNAETYDQLLRTTVFEPSCISLITEPAFFERETIHTEKTVMAIYGGTIPVWVGGWRLADTMRSMGFDVFDDIVDHSYETLADPMDRVYSAIERNLALLQDHTRVAEFIKNNQDRFAHNLTVLQSNPFLQICHDRLAACAPEERAEIKNIIPDYRNGLLINSYNRQFPPQWSTRV